MHISSIPFIPVLFLRLNEQQLRFPRALVYRGLTVFLCH